MTKSRFALPRGGKNEKKPLRTEHRQSFKRENGKAAELQHELEELRDKSAILGQDDRILGEG